jgi:hypothetical protein
MKASTAADDVERLQLFVSCVDEVVDADDQVPHFWVAGAIHDPDRPSLIPLASSNSKPNFRLCITSNP